MYDSLYISYILTIDYWLQNSEPGVEHGVNYLTYIIPCLWWVLCTLIWGWLDRGSTAYLSSPVHQNALARSSTRLLVSPFRRNQPHGTKSYSPPESLIRFPFPKGMSRNDSVSMALSRQEVIIFKQFWMCGHWIVVSSRFVKSSIRK